MVITIGRLRLAMLAVLVVLPGLGLLHASLFDPHDYYADQGISGPFEAIPDGITADGRPRFRAGALLDQVRPGQVFAWVSSVCLEEGQSMLARSDVVRMRDDRTVVTGRQVLITPEWRRCGPAVGSATLPEDADDGDYELRRLARVRPLSFLPLNAPLRALSFKVRRVI